MCPKQVGGGWVCGLAAVVRGWVGEWAAFPQTVVVCMRVFGDYVAVRLEVVGGGRAMKSRCCV